MTIKWNRQGTPSNPRHAGGTLIEGKVALVSAEDAEDAVFQAWEKLAQTVIPLNAQNGWDTIQCRLNFSSGYVTFSVLARDSDPSLYPGTVSLVTGNFLKAWAEAAVLDDGGQRLAFRQALLRQQHHWAETILRVGAEFVRTSGAKLTGTEIRFTCVGTDKVLVGTIGSSHFYPTNVAEMQVEPSAPEAAAVVKWENLSEVPGNVIYAGRCRNSLDEQGLAQASEEMWRVFTRRILPLNSAASWDHIRCEFLMDSDRLMVFVASHPFTQRVDQGSCCLSVGNFTESWREYDRTGDMGAVRSREAAWSKAMADAAGRVASEESCQALAGVELEFWGSDDEMVHEATVAA